MRSRRCLTSRHFHSTHPLHSFPPTVVPTAIHTLEDSLVDWINKGFSQVMSPTSLPRRAVPRSRLRFYRWEERISGRRIILDTCVFESGWDVAWECWPHCCLRRRERQVQPQQELFTPTEKILCHAHHIFQSRGNLWRFTRTNGNRAGAKKVSEHRKVRDYCELRAD